MIPRKYVRSLLTGVALACAGSGAHVSAPAHAQFGGIVYDPSNYAQNVLTAARTLEQINIQIRMLQNQANSLVNEARNLQSLPLTVLQPLQDQIRQTQQLLQQAQRIAYDVREIETTFDAQYKNIPLNASQQAMVNGAEARWQNSVAGFEDALKVQAGAVANIEGSREAVGRQPVASRASGPTGRSHCHAGSDEPGAGARCCRERSGQGSGARTAAALSGQSPALPAQRAKVIRHG
jgi:P-type conjugative transfer protein TrbJ